MQGNQISAKILKQMIDNGLLTNTNVILLDVRTPTEFSEGHIDGATNIQLDDFKGTEDFLSHKEKIFLICKGGIRAGKACQRIPSGLAHKVFVLEGGMDSWIKNGYDFKTVSACSIPVLQQMQVIVGLGTLVGSLLTVFVSKWFGIVPIIFGTGLTFAGLTGFCMLLNILDKMPWNRPKS